MVEEKEEEEGDDDDDDDGRVAQLFNFAALLLAEMLGGGGGGEINLGGDVPQHLLAIFVVDMVIVVVEVVAVFVPLHLAAGLMFSRTETTSADEVPEEVLE